MRLTKEVSSPASSIENIYYDIGVFSYAHNNVGENRWLWVYGTIPCNISGFLCRRNGAIKEITVKCQSAVNCSIEIWVKTETGESLLHTLTNLNGNSIVEGLNLTFSKFNSLIVKVVSGVIHYPLVHLYLEYDQD